MAIVLKESQPIDYMCISQDAAGTRMAAELGLKICTCNLLWWRRMSVKYCSGGFVGLFRGTLVWKVEGGRCVVAFLGEAHRARAHVLLTITMRLDFGRNNTNDLTKPEVLCALCHPSCRRVDFSRLSSYIPYLL